MKILKAMRRNFHEFVTRDEDEKEAVDAEDILWSILKWNKIEEIRGEFNFLDDNQVNEFSVFPKSKTAILDEPIWNLNLLFLNQAYYYPTGDVNGLLNLIARGAIQNYTNGQIDYEEDSGWFSVTFYTKNKKVIVDELGT